VAGSPAPDGTQAGTPPSAQSAGNDGEELQDIIVTAQRREQSLQQVPISVAAFTAENVNALSAGSIGDLDNFTPSVDQRHVGDAAQLYDPRRRV
jgi:iron complex outermembrane receptor protein